MLTTNDEQCRHYYVHLVKSSNNLLEYPVVDEFVGEEELLGLGHEGPEVEVLVWIFEDHVESIEAIEGMQIQIVVQKYLKFSFLNEFIKEVISTFA